MFGNYDCLTHIPFCMVMDQVKSYKKNQKKIPINESFYHSNV